MDKNKHRRNFIFKRHETIVVSLLILVFTLGFFMGNFFTNKDIADSEIAIRELQLDLRSAYEGIFFNEIFEGDACTINSLNSISDRLYHTGVELSRLDESGVSKKREYEILKQMHNLNQVLFYTEFRRFTERCQDYSGNIILFFFDSNDEENSLRQGSVLDRLVLEYDLRVIAMDYGFTPSLSYFYNFYDVDNLPFLVLNFNQTFSGYTGFEELGEYFHR